jgi:hypothetical protein
MGMRALVLGLLVALMAPDAEAAGFRLTTDGTRLVDEAGRLQARLLAAGEDFRVVDADGHELGRIVREGGAWRVEDARRRRVGQFAAAYRATTKGCFARWSVTDAAYRPVAVVDDSGEVRDAAGRLVGKLRAHIPEAVGLLLLR